jgi:hypothetical protein
MISAQLNCLFFHFTKVNVKERADLYVSIAKRRAEAYRTNHLLIPIGEDFQFMNAVQNFKVAKHSF